MAREGFQPDFPPRVLDEVQSFAAAPTQNGAGRDLRGILWSSIDNTESRDLDQVEWAERLPDGTIRVLVGIADVDAVVGRASATDVQARANATSVYTGGPVFPMLPERLSTDVTSLGPDVDRRALVMQVVVGQDGAVACADVQTAVVRNQARLNYDQVAAWLQTSAASAPPALREQLLLQEEASRRLKAFRKEHGALTLGGVENIPIVVNNTVEGFAAETENPARDIIESFMIAANVAMARFLRARNSLCLRRVVRTPKRWDRIQALAAPLGAKLPDAPDPKALDEFLARRKQTDPDHFPELSLAVLKSLVCGGASGRRARGPLWLGGQRLHPFDRAQPALRGPCHAAPLESQLAAGFRPVHGVRIIRIGRALHRARGGGAARRALYEESGRGIDAGPASGSQL